MDFRGIITIILFVLAFYSCRSIQYVPIESNTTEKDSVITRDSVVMREVLEFRDSVVIRDSVVTIVDDKGNVIRTELYKQKEIYKDLQREYNELLNRYENLMSQKNDTTRIPYPVEKQLTRWQSVKMEAGGFALGGVAIVLLLLIIKFTRKLI